MPFGGNRVDNLTIFMVVMLIVYSSLTVAITSAFTGEDYISPLEGLTIDLELGNTYAYSQIENVTGGWFNEFTLFDILNPDRKVYYSLNLFGDNTLNVVSYGLDWWNQWVDFELEPRSLTESEILSEYDSEQRWSKIIYSNGGELETHVFYCPLFHYDNTTAQTYIYNTLEESFENEEITVICATNQTFANYGIGDIFGLLTGFSTYDIPSEIGLLLSGVFWGLLVLTVVKLILG